MNPERETIIGRIDVHAHLLPGIDDGCKTVAESIQCARALVANGYTHAFCTPHIWAKYEGVSRVSVPNWCAALQAELDKAQVPLKLLPGAELNLFLGVEKTAEQDIVPLGLGNHILVDMWAAEVPPFFESAIRWLQGMGLKVIMAHPERMRLVQDDPETIDYFQSLDIALQGNLQCFGDKEHAITRICAERFLLDGRYFLLGSDTHSPDSMEIRMRGLARVNEMIGSDKTLELTRDNPIKLVPDVFARV